MQTKVQVSLNGVALHSLNSAIILQSVNEKAAVIKNTAVTMGSRIGQLVTGTERQYVQVQVVFAIANKTLADRQSILQAVAAWAGNGGALTVNYRSGQYLDVVLQSLFDEGYIYQWTNTFTVTFRAYAVPYWQAVSYTEFNISESISVNVPGNAPTPLEVTFKPTNAVEAIYIWHEDSSNKSDNMIFNTPMSAGATFTMAMSGPFVTAHIGTVDVLSSLNTSSVGMIMMKGGKTERVSITGRENAEATARVRARWL